MQMNTRSRFRASLSIAINGYALNYACDRPLNDPFSEASPKQKKGITDNDGPPAWCRERHSLEFEFMLRLVAPVY